MHQALSQLLEAHVQHELALFKPKKLPQTIRAEVAALFQWLAQTKLRQLVTPEQIISLITRNVAELPITDGVWDLTRKMTRRVAASRQNRNTAVEEICPRASFDAVVAKVGSLDGARHDLIHKLVSSSVYTEQISDILFTGIKEYLLTENILAQKVPGLAALIKIGKFAVNKTMRPLEVAVEKTVKAYIETNLGNTIRRSEQSINDYFSQAHLVELGDALWVDLASTKLSEYFKWVPGQDLDDFVDIGQEFWLHFRQTAYFKVIYTDLVRYFFEKYADSELSLIAAGMGVNEKHVASECVQALSHGVETAIASGFLEQRIRARLESFYRSAPALKLTADIARSTPEPKPAKSPTASPAVRKPARRASSATSE